MPDKTSLTFTLEDDGGIIVVFACKNGWSTHGALSAEDTKTAKAEGGAALGRMLLIQLEAGFIQHVKGGSFGGMRTVGCGCEDAMTMLGIVGSLAKAAPHIATVGEQR